MIDFYCVHTIIPEYCRDHCRDHCRERRNERGRGRRDDVYIVPTFEWNIVILECDFCCNGILIIWIFVGTRHGTSLQVWDYGWEIYDNCIFCVGTMCTSSQYLMEYCDLGMGF